MKKLGLIVITLLLFIGVKAQTKIKNIVTEYSDTTGSITITYDLFSNVPLYHVKLEVTDSIGNIIIPVSLSGDLGDKVDPGTGKSIIWFFRDDGRDYNNEELCFKVLGKIPVSPIEEIPKIKLKPKKEFWMNWWFIAAGASAVTGTYCKLKANNIYNSDYFISSTTSDANELNQQIRNLDNISTTAYAAAGAFTITGIIIQIKHNKTVQLSYSANKQGAIFGLTYNF